MKRFYFSLAFALLLLAPVRAQDSAIAAAENLIVDGIPKIQASLAETAGRYASYRSASLADRSEEHTSELQSRLHLVCRLLLEKKKKSSSSNTSEWDAWTNNT